MEPGSFEIATTVKRLVTGWPWGVWMDGCVGGWMGWWMGGRSFLFSRIDLCLTELKEKDY